MSHSRKAILGHWGDVALLDGVRTPFVDINGALQTVSPTDLGIKAARAILERTGLPAADIGSVVCGSMAQAAFDAYFLPRHIGLYAGVPEETPAHLAQRICGTGIEILSQAADAVALGRVNLALCVGAESMSRNPVAAYTHRSGFRMGQVEFKDFLWEALYDPAAGVTMGGTAENLAKKYNISREQADEFAAGSFSCALAAQENGFLAGEIVPVTSESFTGPNLQPRAIQLPKNQTLTADSHIRLSSLEALAKIRPAFGGVQTGGNSSGLVDGAAAALLASSAYARSRGVKPLAQLRACVSVGVPPAFMGIGPAPAIQTLLAKTGLRLDQIDRIEINEAFAAQVLACALALGLDRGKLNVNGGAIAIGHPLAATGVRLTVTCARELKRKGLRYGIASACIGGGQGIAMLIENPDAARGSSM